MRKRFSIAEARDRFAQLVRQAETGSPIEVTRRGEGVAMIVARREFERLAQRRTSFWAALERFRREEDLVRANIDPERFGDARDRSRGREVTF